MINTDQHLAGSLLKNFIEEYINIPHRIYLIKQEQKVCSIETVKIINYDILELEQS